MTSGSQAIGDNMKCLLITLLVLILIAPVSFQASATPVQSGFVCVLTPENSARFNGSNGQFVIDVAGHSEVSGIARIVSQNPLALSFHSTESDARISVIDGIGMVFVSIAHGLFTTTFGGATVACDNPPPTEPLYVGNADGIICEAVYGWAADRARPSVPITVGVYVDGVKVEDVLASLHRQDVANWLQSLGYPDNGNHGFAVPFPVRDGRQHTVSVKFEQSNVDVGHSPRSATCQPF